MLPKAIFFKRRIFGKHSLSYFVLYRRKIKFSSCRKYKTKLYPKAKVLLNSFYLNSDKKLGTGLKIFNVIYQLKVTETIQFKASSKLRRRNLKTQLFFYALAYHPHLSVTKTKIYKNVLQTGGIWKRRVFFLGTFWERSFLKFFSQTQIQNDWWLLCFLIPPT